MKELHLKSGRERPVLRRHPWLFSGAIASVLGDPAPGETVEIFAHNGDWLARAAYSPHSQIRARIWTWTEGEAVDKAFLRERVRRAVERRSHLREDAQVAAYREIHAESDGLPGLIVDRYGDLRVVQFLSAGVDRWREDLLDALCADPDCSGVFERSDADVRELEGLPERRGPLRGRIPNNPLTIVENGFHYLVDFESGHKTGFYLDLREARGRLRRWLGHGRLLNAFAYTGAFTVIGLAQGVSEVVSVDTSEPALELARQNVRLNGLPLERCRWENDDVFNALRRFRDRDERFDFVLLDPPKFAATRGQVEGAARGYKDINILGMKLLRPGGILATFSCSSGVGPELFQKIVADAALDAGVDARALAWLGQPSDHPVALNYPEGRYLKGMVVHVSI